MILPEKRKQLEYDLTAAETAVREQDFDLPIAWAILFLYDNAGVIMTLLMLDGRNDEYDELERIIDWIKNGDPETRDND
jgi:hypothetical protein